MNDAYAARQEETILLIESAQAGSEEAMERLVESNMPLVRSIALRFSARAEADDLMQTGSIGLIKAVRNFNTQRGVRFSTYAVPLIAGEIRRFLRDSGQIRVSRSIKELSRRIAEYTRAEELRSARTPKLCEIAFALGVSSEDAAEAVAASAPCVSLFEPTGEDGQTLVEICAGPDDVEREAEPRVMAESFIASLPDDEARVIRLRFMEDLTQTAAAEKLGVTQATVSRTERRALDRLRRSATYL